jgi:hypothetical protein
MTNSTDTLEIKLPFQGFYESIHDMNIDDVIEREELSHDSINTKAVRVDYSKLYAETLSGELSIPFTFKELVSPRFYNYGTDCIYVDIEKSVLYKLFNEIDMDTLSQLVVDRFTSRDGFHSFYSNDLSEWGEMYTWEQPQLNLILEVYISEQLDDDWEMWLMSDNCGNGYVQDIVWKHTKEEV